jgi:hypothetical protein
MRTVAPDPAVPERRKMTREPSSMRKRTPWFLLSEPSTGSRYLGCKEKVSASGRMGTGFSTYSNMSAVLMV